MSNEICKLLKQLTFYAVISFLVALHPALLSAQSDIIPRASSSCIPGEFILKNDVVPAKTRLAIKAAQAVSGYYYEPVDYSRTAILVRQKFRANMVGAEAKLDLCKKLEEKVRSDRRLAILAKESNQAPGLVRRYQCDCNGTIQLSSIPNDSRASEQWAISQDNDVDANLKEAWDLYTGSDEVVVAAVDTGLNYNHPDLAQNVWVNQSEIADNGIDDDGNGYIDDIHGINAINSSGDPMDDNHHGTHVSGTIGAAGNNKVGVAGINWNVRILGAKFLGPTGGGSLMNSLKAIDYVTDLKKRGENIVAVNASYGSTTNVESELRAIERLRDAGVLFVAAAGNEDSNNDLIPSYPSNYRVDNIISVAAIQRDGALARFPYTCGTQNCESGSNYGVESVRIAAPGRDILSTGISDYITLSGTSMAAPHVTGALALLAGYNPSLQLKDLKDTLLNSAKYNSKLNGLVEGSRMLDVAAMLKAVKQGQFTGIRGAIFDDKGAVVGASVLINQGLSQFVAKSNILGSFKVKLPPGSYQIHIYKPGIQFTPAESSVTVTDSVTDVGTFHGVGIVPHKIFGKISALGDINIPGVKIEAYVGDYLVGSAISNVDGIYNFPAILNPGKYRILASHPLYSFGLNNFEIELGSEDKQIDFTVLKRLEVYQISGKVQTYFGEPLVDVPVSIVAAGSTAAAIVYTNATGDYLMPYLNPGEYSVSVPGAASDADGNSYILPSDFGKIIVNLKSDAGGISFAYTRSSGRIAIPGTVRTLSGAPLSGVSIKVYKAGRLMASAISKNDGSFQIEYVPWIAPVEGYSVVPELSDYTFDPPLFAWRQSSADFTAMKGLPAPPTIAESPTDYESYQGSNDRLNFRCKGDGFGIERRWSKSIDGVKYTASSDLVLSEKDPSLFVSRTNGESFDGYYFRCLVTNLSGSVLSKPARVRYMKFPRIGVEKTSLRAGETTRLKILDAFANGQKYIWRVDGGSATCLSSDIQSCDLSILRDATVKLGVSLGGDVYLEGAAINVHLIPPAPSKPTLTYVNSSTFRSELLYVISTGTIDKFKWYRAGNLISTTVANSLNINLTYADSGIPYTVIASNEGGDSPESDPLRFDVQPLRPVITTPLKAPNVELGDRIDFVVVATGEGTLKYSWYRGGNLISGATGTTYTIDKATLAENQVVFTVRVENTAGLYVESSVRATVTLPAAPKITQQPGNITIRPDEVARFSVTAEGKGLTYSWYRSGIKIASASSSSLEILPPFSADFDVSVNVSNAGGQVTSNFAHASVVPYSRPLIINQPKSIAVNEGSTALFTIEATGEGLSYKWLENGTEIAGAYSSSYIIPVAARSMDATNYQVIVTSLGGEISSNTVTLTVLYPKPPRIVAQPQNLKVENNLPATFSVVATGTDLKYQWYMNGQVIKGAAESTYMIKDVTTVPNNSLFKVAVSNSEGVVFSNDAILTVVATPQPPAPTPTPTPIPAPTEPPVSEIEPPKILKSPSSGEVRSNSQVSLFVIASGSNLTYQWQRNGVDIQGAVGATYGFVPRYTDNFAIYRVRVSNQAGSVYSTEVVLSVSVGLKITKDLPVKLTKKIGQSLKLSVVASCLDSVAISYQWYRNSKPISGATSPSLTIGKVSKRYNKNNLFVIVSAGSEKTSSKILKLIVK